MAATKKTFTGDGGTVLYPVSFTNGFISRDDVYVYLDGNVYTDQLTYTWINDTQIQLNTSVAVDQVFYIQRIVDRDEAVNNYTDGAVFKKKNLNDSYDQALMIIEEIDDGFVLEANSNILDTIAAAGGVSYVQEAVPVGDDITEGTRWYKPSEATTFVYYVDAYSSQWVEEHPATGGTEVQPTLVLAEGQSEPTTTEGVAQLWVDTDLKIKFGDGTVKTVVTNP